MRLRYGLQVPLCNRPETLAEGFEEIIPDLLSRAPANLDVNQAVHKSPEGFRVAATRALIPFARRLIQAE